MVANSTEVCITLLGSPIDPLFKFTTETYFVEKFPYPLPIWSLWKYADVDAAGLSLTDWRCITPDNAFWISKGPQRPFDRPTFDRLTHCFRLGCDRLNVSVKFSSLAQGFLLI